jgi:hypothetical protein
MDVLKRLSRFLAGADLPEQQRDGGREIRLVGLIVLVGTLTAAVFHLAVHLTTGKGYPYDTFLFDPRGTFNDFNSVYHTALVYGPPHTTDTVYSTPLHLLMTYATALPDVVVWMIFNAVFLATLVAVVWYGVTRRVGGRRLRQAYTAIFVALSYPVLFALQLGNLEMLMFVLLAAFAYLHYERKSRWSWVPLALAIAGKYYVAVLLVLYVRERRWKELAYTVTGAMAVTVLSAIVLAAHSGFTVPQVLGNTRTTLDGFGAYATNMEAVQHGHSLWGLFRLLNMYSNYVVTGPNLSFCYLLLCLAIFAWVSVRVITTDLAPWKCFTALLVAGLCLPIQSHDYTLVHILLPLALIGAYGADSRHGRRAAILLGLLLIPADYRVLIFDVTSSAIVYPLVCIALIVTCVTPDAAPQVVEARGDAFGTRRFAFRRNRGRAVSADDATISVASTRATDTGGERP